MISISFTRVLISDDSDHEEAAYAWSFRCFCSYAVSSNHRLPTFGRGRKRGGNISRGLHGHGGLGNFGPNGRAKRSVDLNVDMTFSLDVYKKDFADTWSERRDSERI